MKTIQYTLSINTDAYAGNFERQLCAYCTGQVGECGVGEDEQEVYSEEETYTGFDDTVRTENDEGCGRPCTIGGKLNQSVFIYFYNKPSKEELDIIKRRALAYGRKPLYKYVNPFNILGYTLIIKETKESEVNV